MKALRRIILQVAAMILACLAVADNAAARKIRSKMPVKNSTAISSGKEKMPEEGIIICESDSTDNISKIADKIRFYGFDKTANSSTESFFISNRTDSTLRKVILDILYLDMQGRQLHRRDVRFECEIPCGETKRQDVKSWDTQKSFYYYQSAKPRRQATPFKVKLELKGAVLTQASSGEETIVE